MDYSIGLYYGEKLAEVEPHAVGSVHVAGGNTDAEMLITHNYTKFFHRHLDSEQGLRWLYGKTGRECIDRLTGAVTVLGTESSNDYWDATPGNAGTVLAVLLEWAKRHPEAMFDGE